MGSEEDVADECDCDDGDDEEDCDVALAYAEHRAFVENEFECEYVRYDCDFFVRWNEVGDVGGCLSIDDDGVVGDIFK